MTCVVPDLSHDDLDIEPSTPLALDYGVIMDGVMEIRRLTDNPQFSPLMVHLPPVVYPFDDVIKFKEDMLLVIKVSL